MRHLHDKVKTLESRTAPPPEDTSVSDSTSAAAAGLIMGGMMMTDTLMIQNGPVYGSCRLALSDSPCLRFRRISRPLPFPSTLLTGAGYGAPGGIPDPYAQQQQQYGYGAPAYNAGYAQQGGFY